MDEILKLQKMIEESNNIVFFSGAGVSTESGIKDFRSKDGIYNQKTKYPPEFMLSADCFYNYPKDFFDFYRNNMNSLSAKPNITHKYLKDLEDSGKLKAIVTQNIDGLHTLAGCKNVYEIHGTIHKNHCLKCHKEYGPEVIFNSEDIPICKCGGTIKPDVVLYGEMLAQSYEKAIESINKADMLIVAGTSLTVQPASSMLYYFHGKYLVIINKDETPYDYKATLVIHKPLKEVMEYLIKNCNK